MRKTQSLTVALSLVFSMPLTCLANEKEGYAGAVQAFANPLHCAWLSGEDHRGDGIPARFSIDMNRALEAGAKAGATNSDVMAAIGKACAARAWTNSKP